MTLDEIAKNMGTDKSSRHHGYCFHYESLLFGLKFSPITLMEIGYGGYHYPDRGGEGARMWLDYFQNATVISVDIYDKTNIPETDRFKFYKASQDDKQFLTKILCHHNPDIVIDDASHTCPTTIRTFDIVFPLLKSGGYYFIEDVETSFSSAEWAQGTDDCNDYYFPTSVNLGRKLVTDVNHKYIGGYEPKYNIESIHFFSNLIAIKKK